MLFIWRIIMRTKLDFKPSYNLSLVLKKSYNRVSNNDVRSHNPLVTIYSTCSVLLSEEFL